MVVGEKDHHRNGGGGSTVETEREGRREMGERRERDCKVEKSGGNLRWVTFPTIQLWE